MKNFLLCAAFAASVLPVCSHAGAVGCADFAWNVTLERTLFQQKPSELSLASSIGQAPRLQLDRLYRLDLIPQAQVRFAHTPGKTMLAGGDYAGVAWFTVPASGIYRVSIDQPFWIDVVQDGKLAKTIDFTGDRHCAGPRKIVKFRLVAGAHLYLQLSGSPVQSMRLTLTRDTSTAPAAADIRRNRPERTSACCATS